jgi:YbgC/YbaW family acyl-CoA thioester hydrolase
VACEFKQIRRVEWVDTDAAGIIHFTAYFRFMEATEHAFYRSLGLGIDPRPDGPRIGWPRVAASCEFKAPLKFADEVEVRLLVREKREKSLAYVFVFSKVDGARRTEVARGALTVVSVAVDRAAGTMKSVPMPREFAEAIEPAPADLLGP